ncbi:MAG: phage tail tape measure protein [Paraclostridium sp.]
MSVNLGSATAYVELDATKFNQGFKMIGQQLRDFNTSTKSTSEKLTALGGTFKTTGASMTKSFTLPLAGIGAVSVKTAADFEGSMLQVAATMGMTADEVKGGSEQFEKLEKAAKDMGATTQFSATESAEALNYMALAGYDVDTAISTLPKVLDLAAAGGMGLAEASDMVTDGLSALGLEAKDADRFVDVLAKTSQKSNTSVSQLGEGLLTVGGTAKILSGGVEEASTAIGILSDNGIKGSEAGTALRNVILSLSSPTDKAAKALKNLGVEAFDSEGNMRPLNETFKDLDGELSKLSDQEKTQVLSEIFNKVDLKSVNALLANSGERFDELSGYINDADGAASDMAETMNSGLNGQLTLLKSSLEGAAISIGEALIPVVEKMVEWIQKAVDWFNNLDGDTQTLIATMGLLVAAIGPILMIIGLLIKSFTIVGGAISTVTGLFTGFGGAATVVTGAASALASVLTGGVIFALVAVIAKIGESESALGWLQDKFGSVGTVIGGVCEFIAGIWNITIDNIINVGKLGFDVLAAMIDGPGGATVKDAFGRYTKGVEEINKNAWDNITMKTTRELSQQKNSVDKETKEASKSADKNTKDMAKAMDKNSKDGAKSVSDNMQATSKVVMDESGKIPKDVQTNMNASVQAMRQAGSDIYNGMNTSFSKLASQGKQHFTDLYNGTTRSSSKMASQVIADWNRIRSALSGTITGNVQIKVHGVQAALNQINSVKNAANRSSFMGDSMANPSLDSIMLLDEVGSMLRSDSMASYVASGTSSTLDVNVKSSKNDKKSLGDIKVDINIDKFENKTNDSPIEFADKVIDRVVYKLKRERIAIGGA